jgi:hypothetical protein
VSKISVPEHTIIEIGSRSFSIDLVEALRMTEAIRKDTADKGDWAWLAEWKVYLASKAGFDLTDQQADHLWSAVAGEYLDAKKKLAERHEPRSPSSTESTPSS